VHEAKEPGSVRRPEVESEVECPGGVQSEIYRRLMRPKWPTEPPFESFLSDSQTVTASL